MRARSHLTCIKGCVAVLRSVCFAAVFLFISQLSFAFTSARFTSGEKLIYLPNHYFTIVDKNYSFPIGHLDFLFSKSFFFKRQPEIQKISIKSLPTGFVYFEIHAESNLIQELQGNFSNFLSKAQSASDTSILKGKFEMTQENWEYLMAATYEFEQRYPYPAFWENLRSQFKLEDRHTILISRHLPQVLDYLKTLPDEDKIGNLKKGDLGFRLAAIQNYALKNLDLQNEPYWANTIEKLLKQHLVGIHSVMAKTYFKLMLDYLENLPADTRLNTLQKGEVGFRLAALQEYISKTPELKSDLFFAEFMDNAMNERITHLFGALTSSTQNSNQTDRVSCTVLARDHQENREFFKKSPFLIQYSPQEFETKYALNKMIENWDE